MQSAPKAAIALLLAVVALPASATAARRATFDVLLVGDSHTYGATFVADGGDDFAELLALQLGEDFDIRNAGCAGSSSVDWVATNTNHLCRQGWEWQDLFGNVARPLLPAHLATVLLGTNDAIGYGEPEPVAADAYAGHIDALIEALIAEGLADVVLMIPPLIPHGPIASERLARYRERLIERCTSDPIVHCGPDLQELLDPVAHFETGDLHLNGAGHAVVAQELTRTIGTIAAPEPTHALSHAIGVVMLAAIHRARRESRTLQRSGVTTRSGRRSGSLAGPSTTKTRGGESGSSACSGSIAETRSPAKSSGMYPFSRMGSSPSRGAGTTVRTTPFVAIAT